FCTSSRDTWRKRGSGWRHASRSTGSTDVEVLYEEVARMPRSAPGAAVPSPVSAPDQPPEVLVAPECREGLATRRLLPPPRVAVDGEGQGPERERRVPGARVELGQLVEILIPLRSERDRLPLRADGLLELSRLGEILRDARLVPRDLHVHEPPDLQERSRVVVHPDVDPSVGRAAGVADRLDDQDAARLLASRVAARRFARVERGHEALGEHPLGLLECAGHLADDAFAREDVALRRVVLALDVSGPVARA